MAKVKVHGFLPEWHGYYEAVMKGGVPDEHLTAHMASFVAGWLASLRTIQTILNMEHSAEALRQMCEEAETFVELLADKDMRSGLESLHRAAMSAPTELEALDEEEANDPSTPRIVH